jgi:ribosomal-protein-alanine N-acetyltransferase
MSGAPRIALLQLDHDLVRRRIHSDDFEIERTIGGRTRRIHVGAEFPGIPLGIYPRLLERPEAELARVFAVVSLDDDELVGQIGAFPGPAPAGDFEFGYGMNEGWWGRGIATRAVQDYLAVLDADPEIETVFARTAPDNVASQRVLAKNGFVPSGHSVEDDGSELLVWRRQP